MKVVINNCWGGYSLSEKAYEELGESWDKYGYKFNDDRSNPLLVSVVEKLGKESFGICAELKVVEIPDGIEWEIDDYDGMETVEEVHRSWS